MASKKRKVPQGPANEHEQTVAKSELRKQQKLARKRLRRNLEPRGPRRKDWTTIDPTEEAGLAGWERIMPRDESDRRHKVTSLATVLAAGDAQGTDAEAWGEENGSAPALAASALAQGLVIEVSTGLCRVALEDCTVLCRLRGSLTAVESQFTNAIAVGDRVRVQVTDGEQGIVEEVLPRRSLLARPDVFKSHRQQIVAANVDQVLVVSSWREPAIWLELIDRYLIAAARYQLPARICINKIDLAEDDGEVVEHIAPYQALGYDVVCTSVLALTGIERLRTLLQDKTTVIAGLSGVGKSSLLTAVQPDLQLRVGSVSQWWGGKGGGHGRHTTTQATLLRLNPTTSVIDTPGIREFGLSGISRGQLGLFFPDIARAAESCRFNDCTHINEPGCAVQTAVRKGTVFASRLHSYRKILETLPA